MEVAGRGNTRQIDGLTSLRFFAASSVMLFHNMWVTDVRDWPVIEQLWQATRNGSVGVGIFFMLSGFILTYVYGRGLEEGSFSRRDFFVARIARIYPVYLFALAISFPGLALKTVPAVQQEGLLSNELWAILTAPLLLQAWHPQVACVWNCPGWSLSSEAFFYALFPFIGGVVLRLRDRHVWLTLGFVYALMLSLAAGYYWSPLPTTAEIDPNPWIQALWYTPALRLPEFVFGILLARAVLRRDFEVPAWVPTACLVVIGLCFWGSYFLPQRFADTIFQIGGLAPLYGLLFVAVAKARPGTRTWLENPVLVRLGEASYALYLVHMPIWAFMKHASNAGLLPDWKSGVFYPMYAAVVIAASLAIYRWIEVPGRQFLRRTLSERRLGKPALTFG
jgi:peptidoglycan/LPS O-acetylase OafA/YrhL